MRVYAPLIGVVVAAMPASATGMGSIYGSFGWGKVTQRYDSTGKAQDYGQDASFSVLNLHLGGHYTVLSLPTQHIVVGGGLHLQQRSYAATVMNQSMSRSSGFAPQGLAVYAGLRGPMYSAKLGFLADLGPKAQNPDEMENSDRQHALFVKAGAHLPNPMFSLGGFIQYDLTFSRTENNVSVDNGDWLIVGGYGGYRIPMGEVGVEIRYILKTAAKSGDQTLDNTDGYLVTLTPYLRISLPASPVGFMLKLATYNEYSYYGLSLVGKNFPVTRLGFTLGAMMEL